jgi:hypothetical protein
MLIAALLPLPDHGMTPMSTFKAKIAAAALAALTLGATVVASTSQAEARWGWGGVGVGLAAGALIGAAAASNAYAQPTYVYAPRCRFVRQYDAYGYYVGTAKVCD